MTSGDIFKAMMFISLLIGLWTYKKQTKSIQKLVWFIAFALFTETMGSITGDYIHSKNVLKSSFTFLDTFFYYIRLKKSNHIIYNVYTVVEFLFLSWLYFKHIQHHITKKVILYGTIFILLIYFFLLEDWFKLNSRGYTVLNVWLIGLILSYYIDLLRLPLAINLARVPMFWISTGWLFYLIGSIPLLGIAHYLIKYFPSIREQTFIINHLIVSLMYILFSVGFLCRLPNQK